MMQDCEGKGSALFCACLVILNTLIMNSLMDTLIMNFSSLTIKLVVQLLMNGSLLKFDFSVVNFSIALHKIGIQVHD